MCGEDVLTTAQAIENHSLMCTPLTPTHKSWQTRSTTDSPHHYCYEGTCASDGCHLYLYGGYDGSDFQGSLHQLDCKTWQWSRLGCDGNGPMRKMGCGMAVYNDQLVLFGGYGISSVSTQPGIEFIPDNRFPEGVGWTNELHVFSLTKGTYWSDRVLKKALARRVLNIMSIQWHP